MTLSVIIPTCGRPTLTRTLASLTPQLADGDEILLVRSDNVPWGNATRDHAIRRAAGTHLWFMDDDDVATDGALEAIRAAITETPNRIAIFRMEGDIHHTGRHEVIWKEPQVEFANVSSQMIVVPNLPEKLGTWAHNKRIEGGPVGRAGDYHFLTTTLDRIGTPPVWHEQVIARIRPHQWPD